MRKQILDNLAFKSYKKKKYKVELQELVDKDKERIKQLEESKKKARGSLIKINEEIEKRQRILIDELDEGERKIEELFKKFDRINELGNSLFLRGEPKK